jgi:hypothetical protein
MDIGEGETQCSNCTNQKDAGVLSKAQVPITIPLLRLALDDGVDQINHLGSREVTPYLIQKLHWRTVTVSTALKMVQMGATKHVRERAKR